MGKLDQDNFCSLFIAVDDFYLNKLLMTYPTWVACHPEVIRMPHVFVADETQVTALDPRWGAIAKARAAAAAKEGISLRDTRFSVLPWSMDHSKGISQREEMLTGLIRCARHVTTPWYLKLDADTYANARKGFYYDSWFKDDVCYISNPWGYAKPGDQLDILNTWAKGIPELKDLPEVPGTKIYRTPDENPPWKVNWSRMASWVHFGNTRWTQWAASLCPTERLPTPSQDTYLSFIQRRTNAKWHPRKFREYGWEHCKNVDGLKAACESVLKGLP